MSERHKQEWNTKIRVKNTKNKIEIKKQGQIKTFFYNRNRLFDIWLLLKLAQEYKKREIVYIKK